MFGSVKDFEPIVDKLVKVGCSVRRCDHCVVAETLAQGDYKRPYDWDDYAQQYFPKAEELISEAEKAEKEGNQDKASEFYL